MQLKVKRLYKDAKLPAYSREGDAGIDLFAYSVEFLGNTQIKYGTGISVEIPQNHVGLLIQRSNTVKRALRLSNNVGVIDSNFRGEILVYFSFGVKHKTSHLYYVGDKVAQLVIVPCPKMEIIDAESLSRTNRESAGFGSSDSPDFQVQVPQYSPRSDGTDR